MFVYGIVTELIKLNSKLKTKTKLENYFEDWNNIKDYVLISTKKIKGFDCEIWIDSSKCWRIYVDIENKDLILPTDNYDYLNFEYRDYNGSAFYLDGFDLTLWLYSNCIGLDQFPNTKYVEKNNLEFNHYKELENNDKNYLDFNEIELLLIKLVNCIINYQKNKTLINEYNYLNSAINDLKIRASNYFKQNRSDLIKAMRLEIQSGNNHLMNREDLD